MRKLTFISLLFISFNSISQTTVPDVSIKSRSGDFINIKTFTNDKIVILSFWATWCVLCINELNNVNDIYDDWQKETGVTLVAVSIDDSRSISRVIPLSNGYDWNYQILFDKKEELKRAFNIYNIPYTIVIDNGEIFYRHSGYKEGDEYMLINMIRERLQNKD